MSNDKPNKTEKVPQTRGNGTMARCITLLIVACGLTGLKLSIHSYYVPLEPHTTKFLFENWGVALIALEAVAAITLAYLQNGKYLPYLLQPKLPMLDERQKQVRQRIYTQAYLVAVLCFAIAVVEVTSYPQVPTDVVGAVVPVRVAWVGVIFLISLPSILAAWTQDS